MIDEDVALLISEAWLLACFAFFIGLLWRLTRPGAREASARHALIPLREDDDGRA